MSFWKAHSAKVLIISFILLSTLILFLDIETTQVFGLTFEEEIIFPAAGILFLAFGLLVLNKKLSAKSAFLEELREMGVISKFFGLFSFFLIVVALILAIFQDLSLFNLDPNIIAEERLVAIGMLLSVLIFLFIYTREIILKRK